MSAIRYAVLVNENAFDARARLLRIESEEEIYPLSGWERVWSLHSSQEEAEAELARAKEWVRGRSIYESLLV